MEVKSSVNNFNNVYSLKLSDGEFHRLSKFIFTNYGIKMPYEKKTMLQSRLHKRLRATGKNSFSEYVDYVFSEKGQNQEVIMMIDVVSTNKTDFFREPFHFEFIQDTFLPARILQNGSTGNTINIWSAGCSSGEEVYTLAMVLENAKLKTPQLNYSILGTDISIEMLKSASKGIYMEEKASVIPKEFLRKYFLRSKNRKDRKVRVKSEIRNRVTFKRLNFVDQKYNIEGQFDLIFCRNVLIYFEKNLQERVINNLCKKLKTGGYFFLGHSESITGMKVPLKQIRPTVFLKI